MSNSGFTQKEIDECLARRGDPYKAELTRLKAEKKYYQDIVYDLCNRIDAWYGHSPSKGGGLVCGTSCHPTRQVQDSVTKLIEDVSEFQSERDDQTEEIQRLEGVVAEARGLLEAWKKLPSHRGTISNPECDCPKCKTSAFLSTPGAARQAKDGGS